MRRCELDKLHRGVHNKGNQSDAWLALDLQKPKLTIELALTVKSSVNGIKTF
jgi:hypothetical protein